MLGGKGLSGWRINSGFGCDKFYDLGNFLISRFNNLENRDFFSIFAMILIFVKNYTMGTTKSWQR